MPDLDIESPEPTPETDARSHRSIIWAVCILLVALTLASRIAVAYYLANDDPGDSLVYAQIARNVLDRGVYSTDTEEPFSPTFIRVPGYPLFLAAVYSVFGQDNNTAVRIVQAVFDTATCVLIALLALLWSDGEERRRRKAFWAYVLAALCPFVVIYTATILTETLATFLMAAMALSATLGFKSASKFRSSLSWALTGLLAGAAVMLRPDTGLFAAGIGLTIVISGLFLAGIDETKFSSRVLRVILEGAVFTVFFAVALAPWTIRNYRAFGVFQPISTAHADMPGEFVPYGYYRWLRTWLDDSRFIEPMLWNLGDKRISIDQIPQNDFDSPEERTAVAALLDQYNHPPGTEDQNKQEDADKDSGSDDETATSDDDNNSDGDSADNSGDESADAGDTDSANDDTGDDEDKKFPVKMTPEIDAQFAAIAEQRIERSPLRFYLFLPAKRAAVLWFDSHSLYYPFGGQMSPIRDLDYDEHQQYWLPAFTLMTWIYTLLALAGAVSLWRRRSDGGALKWLVLVLLMTVPRVIFLSTMENPEPRYLVEYFAFAAVLGGLWLGGLRRGNAIEADGEPEPPVTDRLLSLDVFRGITIAAMTLVNMPGTWDAVYPPLLHAEWNGATPTDWIFPFFLFIVGVSIAFSFGKAIENGAARGFYAKIFRRTTLLFAIGVALQIFPFYNIWTGAWFDPSTTRIMGVLQRIAICYLAASIIFLRTRWKTQAAIVAGILLGYWALMALVPVPGCDASAVTDQMCNLASYIDTSILGQNHIWEQSRSIDPEGLLSTLGAIATTLTGVLAGEWLRSAQDPLKKVRGMLGAGILLWLLGLFWSLAFPLNKWLWTSSYVIYTAGIASIFLAAIYWVVDVKGYKRLSTPFVVFGRNAIALYVGSTIVGTVMSIVELEVSDDKTVSLQEMIYSRLFAPYASPLNASLLFAISFLLVWLFLMWLLYRKRIFIKL